MPGMEFLSVDKINKYNVLLFQHILELDFRKLLTFDCRLLACKMASTNHIIALDFKQREI